MKNARFVLAKTQNAQIVVARILSGIQHKNPAPAVKEQATNPFTPKDRCSAHQTNTQEKNT